MKEKNKLRMAGKAFRKSLRLFRRREIESGDSLVWLDYFSEEKTKAEEMQVRSVQLEKREPFSHQPRYRLQKQASKSQGTAGRTV